MQKIEKWRVEELALLLKDLSELLRKGDNSEWANVFSHFHDESKRIIFRDEFDLDSLKKLIINIKNCFSRGGDFTSLILWHENTDEKERLNQDFSFTRARLFVILKDMEHRTVEAVS